MKTGAARIDITPPADRLGMLGYGMSNHVAQRIQTKLYARAFYVDPGDGAGPPLAIAVAEIAFITPALRRKTLEILHRDYPDTGLSDQAVLLCAQHTHSAPGGYSHHPFYNITTPGLKPDILELFAGGMAQAIGEAHKNRREGSIRLGRGQMEPEREVAFNRSVRAYNRNTDVEPVSEADRHLAVDREMTLLQFLDAGGRPMGSLNWFAVHTTSMPNTSYKVHSDNKGYAALYLEDHHRDTPGYVAAFAQGCAGDVTPNFVFDKTARHNRYWNGPYEDHDRNTLFNGRHQFEKARDIESDLRDTDALESVTDAVLQWKDMSRIDIEEQFSGGVGGACTSPSCLGVDMFAGTFTDGLGFPEAFTPVIRSLSRTVRTYEETVSRLFRNDRSEAQQRKFRAQGIKDILLETGDNRILGTSDIKNFMLPEGVDKTIGRLKHFARKGAFDQIPMTPQVLTFQLVRIGRLALVALPFEITTVAGSRLKSALEGLLARAGMTEVVICPYANTFNGYITTYEEYQEQMYEGGHNAFGQWALAAVTQVCYRLAEQFVREPGGRAVLSDTPWQPRTGDLEKLVF